jgi:hypothetical protein
MAKEGPLPRSYQCQRNTTNNKTYSLCKGGQIATLILHIDNYFIQQIVEQFNRSLTCVAIAILAISIASKSPTITWQGTHCEFMKLITRSKVPCPSLDIHKSNDVVVANTKIQG